MVIEYDESKLCLQISDQAQPSLFSVWICWAFLLVLAWCDTQNNLFFKLF